MDVVRIKKTGQTLYVTGAPPAKKGDKFEATDVLETRPLRQSGCRIEDMPGGGRAISCSRGSSASYGHAGGTIKTYSFDPAIHELGHAEEPAGDQQKVRGSLFYRGRS